MCGIIGYVGSRSCIRVIYDGLKRLEYRGYDSAGIAVLSHHKINLIRAKGKLSELEPLLQELPEQATIGLGHTRWATHGKPSTTNAHPHVTDRIALVHNGIIENYQDLKAGLEAAGVKFSSETDTEVVLHLLAQELKKSKDPKQAIVQLLTRLKGAYSLGILLLDHPDEIYLVKQGSPLVVGLGKGENFFASDIAALVDHTDQAVVLKDGQIARITSQKFELCDFDGHELNPEVTRIEWSADAVEKAGYPHYMLKEIHEQPAVLANLIARAINLETGALNHAAMQLDKVNLKNIDAVHMVACGTAFYSAMVTRYTMESLLKVPVNVELASEFRYREPHINSQSLFIAVSQSGETADTLASLKHARACGAQIMSIVNVRHSEIARLSDAVFYMDCGPEIGVASTKAFTSMVLSGYLLSCAVAEQKGLVTEATLANELRELRQLPHLLQQVLNSAPKVLQLAQKYFDSVHFLYLGRGVNYPIALEGALKLKEISYIHAEGYAAGELKHGPIALIDRNMPILALAPKDRYYDKTVANIEEVKAREGKIIGIGVEGDNQLANLCDDVFSLPSLTVPALQAILNVIPLQLFSYQVAVLRGTDVDQPRNLAKSVTVE